MRRGGVREERGWRERSRVREEGERERERERERVSKVLHSETK